MPINWVIYILFTLGFVYFCGYLSSLSELFFFGLTTLWFISLGMACYVWLNDSYMKYFQTLLIAIGFGTVSLVGFLIFTNLEEYLLILVYVLVILMASFIGYSIRKNLKWNLWEYDEEDPVSGSVRIWMEKVIGVFRIGEMFGKMFKK